MEMEKLKKLTVVMFLISLLALSCSIDTVEADASDCNDACTTACVQPNNAALELLLLSLLQKWMTTMRVNWVEDVFCFKALQANQSFIGTESPI
ncbi:hypothetical protein LINGRAHAP2_LOCUS9204 [Linum grandiflorum]